MNIELPRGLPSQQTGSFLTESASFELDPHRNRPVPPLWDDPDETCYEAVGEVHLMDAVVIGVTRKHLS